MADETRTFPRSQSPADLAAEREALVDSARRDGLDPRPFPDGGPAKRKSVTLPDGGTRYFYGTFYFDMSPDGLIMVHRDDWLSKYALAIDGTTVVAGKFARFTETGLEPIVNNDLIATGDVLAFLPAFKPAPQASDSDTLFEDFERRKALREPGAMGQIMADLPTDNTPQVAKKVFLTAVDAAASPWLKSVLPDADALKESDKQKIFRRSAELTVAVLVYEFFSGEGPATRTFDESTAIVQNIMQSRIADEVLGNYWDRVKAGDPVSPFDGFQGAYRFSPDEGSVGESMDKFIESTDQLLHGDPVLAFLGGVNWHAKPNPDGNFLDVTVTNDSSLSSYAVHEVQSVPRAPAFQIVSPDGPQDASSDFRTPYTTITQIYKFSLPVR